VDQTAIACWPADELLSGVEMEHSSARQISKKRDRNRGSSRRASSRRTGFTRKPLFELLEGRRLLAADFGDAPAPYATLLAANGAQHAELGAESLRLGAIITYEADGQPSENAGADSGDDGVVFGMVRVGLLDAAVTVTVANAPTGAKLDGWIDFDGDGSWSGAEERIFASVNLVEGVNTLTFDVPSGAKSGGTYARFRLSTAGGLGSTGLAANGEVEDYSITIAPPLVESVAFSEARALASAANSNNILSSVTHVDLDGDGDLDLLSSWSNPSWITWHENDGVQGFTQHVISREYAESSLTPIDFDRDGDLDFTGRVSTGVNKIALAWFENDGAQNFSIRLIDEATATQRDAVVVDFDADGDFDFVTTSASSDSVAWYENDGSMTFTRRVIHQSVPTGGRVAVGDIDTDGDLDVVWAPNQGRLAILENVGSQVFQPNYLSQSMVWPEGLHLADINLDGRLDIVTADEVRRIAWHANDGSGAFTTNVVTDQADSLTSFDLGDIDGDGDQDFIFAANQNRRLAWIRNDDLVFSEQMLAGPEIVVRCLTTADLDGDGDLDIVAGGSNGHVLSWFEHGFVATLSSPSMTVEESESEALEFTFEIAAPRDEDVELAFKVSGTATHGVDYELLGHASLDDLLIGKIVVPAGSTTAVLRVVPLDDNLAELDESVTVTLSNRIGYTVEGGPSQTQWIRSNEYGSDWGDAPAPYATDAASKGAYHSGVHPSSLRLGQAITFESDGQPSANASADSGDDGVVFGAVRVGQLNSAVTVTVTNAPAGAKFDGWIDFNGDGAWGGADERIFASVNVVEGVNALTFDVPSGAISGETYARFRLSTAGGLGVTGLGPDGEVEDYAITILAPAFTGGHFTNTGLLDSSGRLASLMSAGDMDGDGDIDLITSSGSEIYWRQNNGAQGFVARFITSTASLNSLHVADMDGDGDPDILAAEISGGGLVWYENQLFDSFVKRTIHQSRVATNVLAADMDGDGDMDVVATTSDNIYWYENTGAAAFVSKTLATAIDGISTPNAVDIDRDGDIDIVVSSSVDNRILWLENNGALGFSQRLIAVAPDGLPSVFAADVDRDGDIDLVGWSGNADTVAWYENTGSQGFTKRVVTIAADNVRKVVAADIDGDGDLDLVAASSVDQTVAWYENDGGQFDAKHLLTYQQGIARSLLAIDIDQDGDIDVVSNGGSQSYPVVFENRVSAGLTSAGASVPEAPGSPLTFHVQLGAPQARATTIELQIGGTALAGFDYAITGVTTYQAITRRATVVIPAGATSATIIATPFADGVAEYGETVSVELLPGDDYTVLTRGMQTQLIEGSDLVGDFGDAPRQTLLIADGARHLVSGTSPLRLGSSIGAERDGQPSENANADGSDDGVTFGPMYAGAVRAPIEVVVANAPTGAKLDAWIDFDGDGVWSGADERVLPSVSVVNGVNLFFVDVPATVRPGQVYARFRLSTEGGLGAIGAAADGEVEDYAVTIDPPAAERGILSAGQAIGSEGSPISDLVAIDLDRDGDTDIISAVSNRDTIAWYENDGAENFTRQVISTAAGSVYNISVADLDGDGDLDLLSASNLDSEVAWYENNGSQSFTHRVIVAYEYSASYVSAVDIDSDGDLDVLLGSYGGGKVAWMENDGSQQFTQRVVTTNASNVAMIEAVDLDRDGDIDLVTAASGPEGFAWYENDGSERFTRRILSQISATRYEVEAVDLDDDGDLDLVLASSSPEGLCWYENQGEQTFVIRTLPGNPNSASQAITADFDGDGDLDVYSRRDGWLFNDGQQNFASRDVSSSTASRNAIADIDGDGVLDLVMCFVEGGKIEWRKNGFSASLSAEVATLSETDAEPATIVFTLDEARDQPTTLNFSVAGTAVFGEDYAVSGHNSFNGTTGTITVPAGQSSVALVLTILDDNLPEFDESLTVTLLGGTLYKALGATTHSLTLFSEDHLGDFGDAPAPYPTTLTEGGPLHFGPGAGSLRLGSEVSSDFDGKPSVNALGDDGDDGVVFGPMRVGQRGAEVTVTVSNAPAGAKLDGWIDFNGDGSWGGAGEQVFVSVPVVEGENVLYFDVPAVIASGVVTYARFRVSSEGGLLPGDVAANGEVEDYAVTMLPPVATQGIFGTPTQILPSSAIRSIDSASASSVVPADMDGDGDLDLVVSRGAPTDSLFWYENQLGDFSTAHLIGQRADVIRLVDLDRDGDLDIFATDQSTLAWHENRGAEGFVRQVIMSGALRFPITPFTVADFDSDGWLDIAIVNNAGNALLWSRSAAAATYTSTSLGSTTSSVTDVEAADLDGDGRLDLVVTGGGILGQVVGLFQTTPGQYVRRTLDSLPTYASAAVDFDGDGDIDLVGLYENGVYFLQNNGAGVFTSRPLGFATGLPNDMAVADFDGDGDIDIVGAYRRSSFEAKSFTLYTNVGGQRFDATTIDPNSSQNYFSIQPADMNGDGAFDLLAVVPQVGIVVYKQPLRAVPTSSSPTILAEGGGPITVRLELPTETTTGAIIPFTISGEAVHGVDYVIDGATSITGGSGLATVPAGSRWVELSLTVIADGAPELLESLAISVGDRPEDRLVRWIASDADAGDYGDAPATYPVGVEQSGAAHLAVGPRLGASRTTELEGVATSSADGDAGDDGVLFGTLVVGAGTSMMTVDVQNAPEGAYIDAWIDFNGDGSWSGEREQVFARRAVVEGENVLQFETPGWATIGVTYARVRLSSVGGLGVTGNAANGEVEDYQVTIATAPGGWVEYEIQGIDPAGTPSTLTKAVDLDRDGLVDVISVGLPSDRSLYWLRNAGDGTFSKQVLSVVDFTMRDFAIDDIDGDGDLDIVVISQTYPSTSRLVLLRNNGANAFSLSVIASSIEASMTVTIADMDGDGAKDILAGGDRSSLSGALPAAGEIVWYVNDGVGNFSSRLIDSQLGPVRSLGAADLDGDGDLDLYASAMNAGSLVMYRNDGAASFTKEVIVATPFTGSYMLPGGKVRATDFDGDGDLDLIPVPNGYSPARLAWYENNSAGVFTEHTIYSGALYSNDVLPVDLDGDGDLDLAIALAATAPSDKPAWIETRLAGDANNDGVVDLADRDFWRANFGSTAGPGLIADLTGDGLVDAADYTRWRDAYDSGVASVVYLPRIAAWRLEASSLAAADWDGDLDLDLVASTSGGIVIARNSFASSSPSLAFIESEDVESEDKVEPASNVSPRLPSYSLSVMASEALAPRLRYSTPERTTEPDRSRNLLQLLVRSVEGPLEPRIVDEAFALTDSSNSNIREPSDPDFAEALAFNRLSPGTPVGWDES
jgi:hypothetical protein